MQERAQKHITKILKFNLKKSIHDFKQNHTHLSKKLLDLEQVLNKI